MPRIRIEKTPEDYENSAKWRERAARLVLGLSAAGLTGFLLLKVVEIVDAAFLGSGIHLDFLRSMQTAEALLQGGANAGLIATWLFYSLRDRDLAQAVRSRKKQP